MRTLFAVALCLAACSPPELKTHDDMAPPPATPPPDMNLPKRAAGDHPPLVTMEYYGGPVVKNIEVWTAVWPGDEALGQRVATYTEWLVDNDEYWVAANGEYGVQRGKHMGWFVLPTAKPTNLDDSAMRALLTTFIADHAITVTENTLVQFIVPETTHQTMSGGGGCQEYLGYHSEANIKVGAVNKRVPYSVNLQCGGGWDELTGTISHEASEVSTDPHPFSAPAYVAPNQPFGGENSDLCNPLVARFRVTQMLDAGAVGTFNYGAARNWSNANATAGNADPCLPAPKSRAYYNVAINPPDISAALPSSAKGGDIYAEIQPYAFGTVGKIKWFVSLQGAEGISIDPVQGENDPGDSVFVTIHVDNTAAAGTYPVLIFAEAQTGGENYWTSTLTLE